MVVIDTGLIFYRCSEPRVATEERRAMHEWLQVATEPAVVRRALKYALVVGAILILINHGDALLHGDLSIGRLLKMGLTMLVPYAVSTASSVGAIREARRANAMHHS
jgi:hypothetical protein